MEELTNRKISEVGLLSAVWAVDPAEKNLLPDPLSLAEAKMFLGGSFSKVCLAYVCGEDTGGVEKSERRMREYLSPLKLGSVKDLQVLTPASASRADAAEAFLTFARKQKAQLILLSSHGRGPLGNFVLGSFAQEILKKSEWPVYFMTPHRSPNLGSKKVLFATDFCEGSKEAFLRFLSLIRGKDAEVLLFHALDFPMLSIDATVAGALVTPLPEPLVAEQRTWAEGEMKIWIEEAHGIDSRLRLRPLIAEAVISVATAIRDASVTENIGMVGLVVHSSGIEKFLRGSVSQNLLSSQKFDLLVWGPASLQPAAEKPQQ